MYRMALREAAALSGVIAPLLTAFLVRREAVARLRSAIPNRGRSDAFVSASPRQAKLRSTTGVVVPSQRRPR